MIAAKIYEVFILRTGFIGRALAVDNTNTTLGVGIPKDPANPDNVTKSYGSWQEYISDIYRLALYLGATLAFIMIIYAGFEYIGSGGDSTKIGRAKEYLVGALIGLAMLYLINYLATVLGIKGIVTAT